MLSRVRVKRGRPNCRHIGHEPLYQAGRKPARRRILGDGVEGREFVTSDAHDGRADKLIEHIRSIIGYREAE